MKIPPFEITSTILSQVAEIQELLGQLHAFSKEAQKPSPKLRRINKIRTVHHSLAIEGNELDEKKITALLENKKVIGPKDQILEVQNALAAYDQLQKFNPLKEKDLKKAHQFLMKGLIENAGQYRSTAVGIMKGSKVTRMAPPAKLVPTLMGDLFDFLNHNRKTHYLIKACVFHYELELIHPFMDGNGRMGRLWQQRILMEHSAIFEHLAVETWIHREQKSYYKALENSDVAGQSTLFIEFSLKLILEELKSFNNQFRPAKLSSEDRIDAAIEHFGSNSFSRKEYQLLHKNISAPTASRDLARAVSEKKFSISGMKATTVYRVRKSVI